MATSTQQAFVARIAPGAVLAQRDTGVPASLTIAQAILESGWGTTALSVQACNLFGQKAHLGDSDPYQVGTVSLPTWEDYGHGPVTITATFYRYPSVAASIRSHARYLIGETGIKAYSERPLPVGADAWARWIVTPPRGYATDPAYTSKLLALMDLYSLRKYDAPTKGAPVTTPTIALTYSRQMANEYTGGGTAPADSEGAHMQDLARQVADQVRAAGVTAWLNPGTDVSGDGVLSFRDEVAWSQAAPQSQASLLISLHSNAVGDALVMCGTSARSRDWQTKAIAALSVHCPMPYGDTWTASSNKVDILTRSPQPAILLEVGRHDLPDYAAWLRAGIADGSLARRLARAILAMVGVSMDAAAPNTPVTPVTPADPRPTVPLGVQAPAFPLPEDSYFGPRDPITNVHSVSGYYSHREDLRRWQTRMAERGWTITADGRYGPQTVAVAHDFQQGKGLVADGLVGPATWAAAWTTPVTP